MITDPFISTSDVVDYIGRGGTADPGMLIAVDAACDIVRDIAEQNFNADTSTITLDGTGTDALLLPEFPVAAAGTVVVAGGTVTDYVLSDNGILFRKQTGTDVDYCDGYTVDVACRPAEHRRHLRPRVRGRGHPAGACGWWRCRLRHGLWCRVSRSRRRSGRTA